MTGLIKIAAINTAKNGNKFATTLNGEAYYFANKELQGNARAGAFAWAIEQTSDKTYKRKENGELELDAEGNRILIERKEAVKLNRITQVFTSAEEAFKAKNESKLLAAQEKAVMRKVMGEVGKEFELTTEEVADLVAAL